MLTVNRVIQAKFTVKVFTSVRLTGTQARGGGGGGAGYVFRDFCLKQGIEFIIFCLSKGIDLSIFVLNRMSFLGR